MHPARTSLWPKPGVGAMIASRREERESAMDMYNAISFVGIFVLMGVAWLLSTNRRKLNLRVICWGVGIQLALGLLVFWAPWSREAFGKVDEGVRVLLDATRKGQEFVFGPLADMRKTDGFVLAFQGLPVIIFFSALMGLLYYWRIMPVIIRGFSWIFTRLMKISGAESLCAASNIFVGIESATAIRPYLQAMTRSEFCTILTAGMATIASSTLGLYVLRLKGAFPNIAGHLISASILSAPAAIVMSKILIPETGRPVTLGKEVKFHHERESGAFEAIISGSMAGVKLVVGIVALLIAFMGMVALIDVGLGAFGRQFGLELSLTRGLGYVMRPFAVIMGVPPQDAALVGDMLGTRLVLTEIPAYEALAASMKAGEFANPRSPVIAAYALCGFAHVASLAIFVGGIAALVPGRRKDLAAVGPRALLAASLACLMTGAVAGAFYHTSETIIQAATTAAAGP